MPPLQLADISTAGRIFSTHLTIFIRKGDYHQSSALTHMRDTIAFSLYLEKNSKLVITAPRCHAEDRTTDEVAGSPCPALRGDALTGVGATGLGSGCLRALRTMGHPCQVHQGTAGAVPGSNGTFSAGAEEREVRAVFIAAWLRGAKRWYLLLKLRFGGNQIRKSPRSTG